MWPKWISQTGCQRKIMLCHSRENKDLKKQFAGSVQTLPNEVVCLSAHLFSFQD